MTSSDMIQPSALFYRHFATYRFVVPKIREKNVLDIGCSDGYGSYVLAKYAKKCVAIDIDRITIKCAKEKYTSSNLRFISMNALDISWKKRFDVVIAFQVIEHIQEENSFLEKIKQSLKKNGVAIFSTPNRRLRLDDGQAPWNPYHVREYSAKDLHTLLIKQFHSVSILGLHATPHIYNLEEKRLRVRRLIAKYDILHLYNHVPRALIDRLSNNLKGFTARINKKEEKRVSVNDFWINRESVDTSLDLIAVCRI